MSLSKAACCLSVVSNFEIHVFSGEALGVVVYPKKRIVKSTLNLNNNTPGAVCTRIFEAMITVIGVCDQLHQRSRNVFAYCLIGLLNCETICISELATDFYTHRVFLPQFLFIHSTPVSRRLTPLFRK